MADDQLPALTAVLTELERHIANLGWDQPARLFALAITSELLAAEPSLADVLAKKLDDSFTAIEQHEFHAGDDLETALARIAWPKTVRGVALMVERTFLPKEFENDIPKDGSAAEFVNQHPKRQDIRVVVGVLRDGTQHCLARLRENESELLAGKDLVPHLATALAATLEDPEPELGENE